MEKVNFISVNMDKRLLTLLSLVIFFYKKKFLVGSSVKIEGNDFSGVKKIPNNQLSPRMIDGLT